MIVTYACPPLFAALSRKSCQQRQESGMKSCENCAGLGDPVNITMTWSNPDDVCALLELHDVSLADGHTIEDDLAGIACLILQNELLRRRK